MSGVLQESYMTATELASAIPADRRFIINTTNYNVHLGDGSTTSGHVILNTENYSGAISVSKTGVVTLNASLLETFLLPIGDETTSITAGTNKYTFRMPYAFNLSKIKASLTTAQTSGSIFTIDIKQSGTSIFSTLLTIDNTEKTSKTAATPAVLSTSYLTDDSEIVIDVTQVGDGTATGLKIYLIGQQA